MEAAGGASRFRLKCAGCGSYHAADPDPAFDNILATACAAVRPEAQSLYERFGIGRAEGRWDLDKAEGEIVWSGGTVGTVRAPYQMAGAWIERSGSWLWAWAHPQATPEEQVAAAAVRDHGAAAGLEVLTTPYLLIDAQDAWHLTGLVAFHAGWPGVYRARVNDSVLAYWAFGAPRWTQ